MRGVYPKVAGSPCWVKIIDCFLQLRVVIDCIVSSLSHHDIIHRRSTNKWRKRRRSVCVCVCVSYSKCKCCINSSPLLFHHQEPLILKCLDEPFFSHCKHTSTLFRMLLSKKSGGGKCRGVEMIFRHFNAHEI